mmetsp:Transcript_5015/g.14601  ORF Transcript_5015/g.14601 Transcript_5015/m.14601 type:complete len:219 (-) Transcript_5015:116-772(-)
MCVRTKRSWREHLGGVPSVEGRYATSPTPTPRQTELSRRKLAPMSGTGESQQRTGSAPPSRPTAASQFQTRSCRVPTDASSRPSDEKATEETGSPCGSVAVARPLPKSHSRTVWSSEPDAATAAAGVTAAAVTGPEWPRSNRTQELAEVSQRRRVPSCEAERAYASEAWKVAAVTSARWPAISRSGESLCVSKRRRPPSWQQERKCDWCEARQTCHTG